MVLTTVTHLNQVKAETTDSERCTIKTETGTATANEEEGANNANSSSKSTIKRRVVMPRRSKRVPKGLFNQVMNNQDRSAAIRSKDIERKRTPEDSSFESSRK